MLIIFPSSTLLFLSFRLVLFFYYFFFLFREPKDFMKSISSLSFQLYSFFSSDGEKPDNECLELDKMKESEQFFSFEILICELQKVALGLFSEAEKLCFYINIFNLLIVHALAVFNPPQNAVQRASFFSNCCYK